MKTQLLTHDEALKIAGALARLAEIRDTPKSSIVVLNKDEASPNLEQEASDLVGFLAENLIKHGGELLGNYFALQGEYSPLVRALAPVVQRVMAGLAVSKQVKNEKAQESK